MADPEDHPPTNPFSPGEAWRRVQEIGAQLTGAASSMAEDFANSPGGQFAEPIARMGARTAELATMWVAPMRAMLEEQQDLVDAIASWAEQQRVLADRFSELAQRHREMTERVMATVSPTLDHVDRLAGRDTARSRETEKPS